MARAALLSPHFAYAEAIFSETATRKGINNIPSERVYQNMLHSARFMEEVRKILGNNPIVVSSWYRSAATNVAVGGSPTSSHKDGFSIDFICPAFGTPYDVCIAIEKSGLKFDQLIHEYGRWTHVSFDPRFRKEAKSIFNGTGYLPGIRKR